MNPHERIRRNPALSATNIRSRFESIVIYLSASEMSFSIVSSMFFTYWAAPFIA
jgi:hypothetical protein